MSQITRHIQVGKFQCTEYSIRSKLPFTAGKRNYSGNQQTAFQSCTLCRRLHCTAGQKIQPPLLYYPGDQPLLTKEGVNALYECVRDLKRQQPLPIIYPSEGLTLAARDHVTTSRKPGAPATRAATAAACATALNAMEMGKRIAENIAYGGKTAQQIVIYLLIDDGVRDRGHRKNFLNPISEWWVWPPEVIRIRPYERDGFRRRIQNNRKMNRLKYILPSFFCLV
jgi:uncharacterized protein YkwD